MAKEVPEVKRPWGGYTILKRSKKFWVKKLFINKNARISLQNHKYRDEVWVIYSGKIIAQVGTKKRKAKNGEIFFVPKHQKHRLTGITNACVLEFAFGKVSEKDIFRYEDDYGRV